MKLFAIVDILGEDPESSKDVFICRNEAEEELLKRDFSFDLVEIEIKKRDDLLLIRLDVKPVFDDSMGSWYDRDFRFFCACVDQIHTNRQLCEVCDEWAGGPPKEEE